MVGRSVQMLARLGAPACCKLKGAIALTHTLAPPSILPHRHRPAGWLGGHLWRSRDLTFCYYMGGGPCSVARLPCHPHCSLHNHLSADTCVDECLQPNIISKASKQVAARAAKGVWRPLSRVGRLAAAEGSACEALSLSVSLCTNCRAHAPANRARPCRRWACG